MDAIILTAFLRTILTVATVWDTGETGGINSIPNPNHLTIRQISTTWVSDTSVICIPTVYSKNYCSRSFFIPDGRNISDPTMGERRDLQLPVPDGLEHVGRKKLQRPDAISGLPLGPCRLQQWGLGPDQSKDVPWFDKTDGSTNWIEVQLGSK